jgi:hypothetical protein
VSRTVIWKSQLERLPEPSVAEQVTVAGEPSSENVVPDAGVHDVDADPQLSVAVDAYVATAPSFVHSSVCGAGHVMTGGSVSVGVNAWVTLLRIPFVSMPTIVMLCCTPIDIDAVALDPLPTACPSTR